MNQLEQPVSRKKKRIRKGPPDAPPLSFWMVLARETLTSRNIVCLSNEMADPFDCIGLENIPAEGTFALAVNHSDVRWTPRLLASLHLATQARRPDLAKEWLVIVGNRAPRLERFNRAQRWIALKIRGVFDRIFRRWNYNCLRIPLGNERASLKALREWRARAKEQPSIVFPEGRASATFKEVRPGSGRWLANLGVPVIPVAAWWDESRDEWVFDFGEPIEWADRSNLHDLQLGLAIAEALPPQDAPDWQEALTRWRKAHSSPEASEEVEQSASSNL